jgi:hypothetical protein
VSATEADLTELLGRAEATPYGPARSAMVEEATQRAESAGLAALALTARLELITAYCLGGEPAKLFVPFARCLADLDAQPERFENWQLGSLLWRFKYVVSAITEFPEISLAQADGVLDDMERRYRAAGYGLHAVYTYRFAMAEHVGEGSASRWYELWTGAERDRLSDCVGCDPSRQVRHLAAVGRDEGAVAVAEPVLTGTLTCVEQPQTMLTALLLPYVRTGRLDEAAAAHRRAYRSYRDKPQDMVEVGWHIGFLARTGNEPRAVELLARHLAWLDLAPSPWDRMMFAAHAALLGRRLGEQGHGEVTVRRPASGERPPAELDAAELQAVMSAEALAIAARFDARNGTTTQSDRVRAVLAAAPLVGHLPLSATARSGYGGLW